MRIQNEHCSAFLIYAVLIGTHTKATFAGLSDFIPAVLMLLFRDQVGLRRAVFNATEVECILLTTEFDYIQQHEREILY